MTEIRTIILRFITGKWVAHILHVSVQSQTN